MDNAAETITTYTSDPDELTSRLEAMKPAEVRLRADQVRQLLNHRSVIVRWAAAEAFGRARIESGALRERLRRERNTLVVTEITESLAKIGDEQSLSQLYSLAEEHPSALVRSYAVLAIADISGAQAINYLLGRRGQERSRRVKATLNCALFAKGENAVFPDLLMDIRSKNFKIRHVVTNLLYYYAPRRKRPLLRAALREAIDRETLPGVRGDLERALEEIS